ncbi:MULTISPECIES: anti-sigma factor [unclassified Isoptericola]|uniref:anti-sigma factor family protein n=1 Tax=unclassified Isoptericola TaxID=2623355 RepID=UPI002713381A|nr:MULTISPECIES: zf-HC2 domain-containing protein [unclassified Isoptericola]MDO8147872.1 zf-HC2 domain-containing protein [Isoptericola sp. b515]MDO8149868.1 zf-HC2 domain-containing protein [Isoptericola sp. b408]
MTASGGRTGSPPDPYVDWDAAYVLGSLGPAERREFEAHLAGCADCRAAVAELAGMPGLLAGLPAGEAVAQLEDGAAADGDAVPITALARRARRSRLRRRSVGAVAAAALAVAGVLTGLTLDAAPPDGGAVVEAADVEVRLAPVGSADVTASVAATSRPWGTLLHWSCEYPAVAGSYGDLSYELVLVDSSGARQVVATWAAVGESARGLQASSALPLEDVVRVEIAVAGRPDPLASADV